MSALTTGRGASHAQSSLPSFLSRKRGSPFLKKGSPKALRAFPPAQNLCAGDSALRRERFGAPPQNPAAFWKRRAKTFNRFRASAAVQRTTTPEVRPTPRSGRFRGPGESKPPGVFGSFAAAKEHTFASFAKEKHIIKAALIKNKITGGTHAT